MNTVYTIGFTKKSAEQFFTLLRDSGAERLLDVRRNNTSQLAAFAKAGKGGAGGDLGWLLAELCGMEYRHLPELAPTQALLRGFRAGELSWDEYSERYLLLLAQRQAHLRLEPDLIVNSVLLCSEHSAEQCHRRLATVFLRERWRDQTIEIVHL